MTGLQPAFASSNFKVLGDAQQSHHGGSGKWRKGQWPSVEGEIVPVVRALA